MVGPWQMPVADCAITLAGFETFAGEAMAIGERTPLALIDAAAAARMAVGEAITNLIAAPVERCESQAVRQLDGGGRASGRRREIVRRGEGRGHGAVPGARI
jgi:phosphoribosylformylglycinamidine (FGAM) synthase-like enzyme